MNDINPCRALWAAAAYQILKEMRDDIQAAMAGKSHFADASNIRRPIGTLAREIAKARKYLNGPDWQTVCDCIGQYPETENIMTWFMVKRETDARSLTADDRDVIHRKIIRLHSKGLCIAHIGRNLDISPNMVKKAIARQA